MERMTKKIKCQLCNDSGYKPVPYANPEDIDDLFCLCEEGRRKSRARDKRKKDNKDGEK